MTVKMPMPMPPMTNMPKKKTMKTAPPTTRAVTARATATATLLLLFSVVTALVCCFFFSASASQSTSTSTTTTSNNGVGVGVLAFQHHHQQHHHHQVVPNNNRWDPWTTPPPTNSNTLLLTTKLHQHLHGQQQHLHGQHEQQQQQQQPEDENTSSSSSSFSPPSATSSDSSPQNNKSLAAAAAAARSSFAAAVLLAVVTAATASSSSDTAVANAAAAVVVDTTPTATTVATPSPKQVVEISTGAPVIESDWITSNPTKLFNIVRKSVFPYGSRLVKTVFFESSPSKLLKSVEKLTTTIQSTVDSEETLKQIQVIVQDFLEQELKQNIEVEFPQSPKQTLEDLRSGKFNLIVNGQIINIRLEKVVTGEGKGEGGEDVSSSSSTFDEYVLRFRRFTGNELSSQSVSSSGPDNLSSSSWQSKLEVYWNGPYPTKYLPDSLVDSGIKRGDLISLNVVAGIGLVYAASWSLYNEDQERAAKQASARKKAKNVQSKQPKKPAAAAVVKPVDVTSTTKTKAAPKPKPKKKKKAAVAPAAAEAELPPPIDDETAERLFDRLEKDVEVKVKISSTTTAATKDLEKLPAGTDDGDKIPPAIAVLEAFYLPWIGMVPGIDRVKFLKFVEVLYLPWIRMVGDSKVKGSDNEEGEAVVVSTPDDDSNPDPKTAGGGGGGGGSVVFKFVRALWFPWVGILSGK